MVHTALRGAVHARAWQTALLVQNTAGHCKCWHSRPVSDIRSANIMMQHPSQAWASRQASMRHKHGISVQPVRKRASTLPSKTHKQRHTCNHMSAHLAQLRLRSLSGDGSKLRDAAHWRCENPRAAGCASPLHVVGDVYDGRALDVDKACARRACSSHSADGSTAARNRHGTTCGTQICNGKQRKH